MLVQGPQAQSPSWGVWGTRPRTEGFLVGLHFYKMNSEVTEEVWLDDRYLRLTGHTCEPRPRRSEASVSRNARPQQSGARGLLPVPTLAHVWH